MYEAHFQLSKRPFSATPDASCFFASDSIQEILDQLVLRAESGQGIGVVTAPAGTGKTILCRRLMAELGERFTVVFLGNANFPTRRALLQSILAELGRRYSGMDEQELRLELTAALKSLIQSDRGAVLIVDEAHLLSERLLEEIRTLASGFDQEQPLLRVILAGQMSLEERLTDPALEALNQRIACHVYLEPLSRRQSLEYVAFRMRWAGGNFERVFAPDALELITHACNGLPRCINQLADHSLLLAYVQDAAVVSREVVDEALTDLKQLPLHWNESPAEAEPPDSLLKSVRSAGNPSEESVTETEPMSAENETSGDSTFIEIGSDRLDDVDESQGSGTCTPRRHERGHVPAAVPLELQLRGGQEIEPPPAIAERPALETPVRVYEEEVVVDRYAVLDSHSPRVPQTFNDTGIPDGWKLTARPVVPPPPQPPAVPSSSPTLSEPERVADAVPDAAAAMSSMESLLGEAVNDRALPMRAAECIRDRATESSPDAESRLILPELPENKELEDELGSSMLDVCLEVQSSLGNWCDVGDVVLPAETTRDVVPESPADVAAAPAIDWSQYDIIEPESEDCEGEERGSPDRRGNPEPRHVPQPNYRHVFSALRRKLGRKLRRDA